MPATELIFAGICGAIIGSFLNVVIYRYNSGQTLGGRSRCLSCGTELSWKELVPVLSFLVQKGKCRSCGSAISKQYVAVELATASAFAGVYGKDILSSDPHMLLAGLHALIWCLLIAIFAYDSRHTVIPDGFVWTFNAAALASVLLRTGIPASFGADALLPLGAGPLVCMPFFLLWFFSRGAWIGFGDAKLALGIGWMLGLSGGISAVLVGVWSGALWSLGMMALMKIFSSHFHGTRKLTAKTEIPFAPFLIIGITLVYFFDVSVIAL